MDEIIQGGSHGSTALNAEHYQSFEMAKANDSILSGDNIAQIRSYAAYARAQAQAIHKTIAATNGIEDVAAIKAEATETAQTFAKVGIYADQRIGEILRDIEQAKRGPRVNLPEGEKTKTETIKESGMSTKTAYSLQAMAANPEVVEAVIAKATEEGRVVSRKQVLDAINEKKRIERELAVAQRNSVLQNSEIASLRQQVAEKPEPEVIEREVVKEVVPDDYEAMKRKVRDLEHSSRTYLDTNNELRRQLDDSRRELKKARDILGMSKNVGDVRRDVQYLVTATNSYVRQYGGLTWTVQQLEQVDEPTREELKKAALNLATFSSALVASLEQMK